MRALILISAAALALAACGDDTDTIQNGTPGTPRDPNGQISWLSNGACEELNETGVLQVVGVEGDEVTVRPVAGSRVITTRKECLVEANAEVGDGNPNPTLPRVDDPLEPRLPSS